MFRWRNEAVIGLGLRGLGCSWPVRPSSPVVMLLVTAAAILKRASAILRPLGGHASLVGSRRREARARMMKFVTRYSVIERLLGETCE